NEGLPPLLDRLAAGDVSAADHLIAHSIERLHKLAHFMLRKYPQVRRWYETRDISQAAALRLRKALAAVKPASAKDFMNLAAVQIRRELCDLLRHEYGPEGSGAHRDPGPSRHEKEDSEAGPATKAEWADLLRHIQDALPPQEREVFDLHWIEGLPL